MYDFIASGHVLRNELSRTRGLLIGVERLNCGDII